jgi:putative transcriptional regulator
VREEVLYGVRKGLKERRKELGYSLAEMGRMVEITRSYYAKIESGKKNPSLRVARGIASVLGDSVENLFNDEEERDSE